MRRFEPAGPPRRRHDTTHMTTANPILRREVVEALSGNFVLRDVTVDVASGHILGLVGENGAGKSHLLKIIAGAVPPSNGSLELGGLPYRPASVADARGRGIGMVFQENNLQPLLTVGENVFMNDYSPFRRFGLLRWRRLHGDATASSPALVLRGPDQRTCTRSRAWGVRLVELAHVLHYGPALLLIDGISASLDRGWCGSSSRSSTVPKRKASASSTSRTTSTRSSRSATP